MNEWLERVAGELGIDATLTEEDADALLKIARIAAHASDDRRTAPLLTYLTGRANRPPQEILEALQRSS
jgi:Domain of unknown function (DUF6457)